MHKNLRYLILLLILLAVAVNEALNQTRTTSWEQPLRVFVYAVDGDSRAATEGYIEALQAQDFGPVESFVNREARRYGIGIDALEMVYRGSLDEPPPPPPSGRNLLQNVYWGLRLRAWSIRHRWSQDETGDIDLVVVYHDTAATQSLRHSVGLQRGLIGIINAFADRSYQGSNQVVITHELLHTLGASDKYDAANMPRLPEGYAEPGKRPLYPQRSAEIMGGRIPLSPRQARMPVSLDEVVIGALTAAEIHWPIKAPGSF